uniref:Uncharacterized protein n=1 Tax=Megaselia scalaris TaxID=36166 RepID=T1H3A4_MEGSC
MHAPSTNCILQYRNKSCSCPRRLLEKANIPPIDYINYITYINYKITTAIDERGESVVLQVNGEKTEYKLSSFEY